MLLFSLTVRIWPLIFIVSNNALQSSLVTIYFLSARVWRDTKAFISSSVIDENRCDDNSDGCMGVDPISVIR